MVEQDASLEHWPNQRLKILIPTWTVLIISTLFVIWRVVYGLRNARKFMLSDYLLIAATVSSPSNSSSPGSDKARYSMLPLRLSTM
jgi:hypothetical protein